MNELPQGWAEATVEDVTEYVQRGKSPRYVTHSELPVINQKCVRWSGVDEAHLKYIDPSQWSGWSAERFLRNGDILWNSTGTGTIGRAAIFRPLVTASRAVADSHVTIVRTNPATLPEYLHRLIQSPFVQSKLDDMQSGSTNQVELSKSEVLETSVPLPPLAEQRRIVAKIDSLTSKSRRARDHLDHLPRLVEKYKQAILAAAFRGELTREWRARSAPIQPAPDFVSARQMYAREMLGSKVKGRDEKTAQLQADADLLNEIAAADDAYPLPPGWCWTSIGSVFGVYVGATPSRKEPTYWNGNVAWVSSGEVAFCRIATTHETITDAGLANTSTRIHPPGTVLVGMIGEGKTRGQAAILDFPACNNQNCAAIRVSEAGYSSEYVYSYLWSVYEETRRLGAGNNQPALNKERVQRLLLPLAPSSEAVEIARVITKAFTWIDRLASEASSARKLINHLDQAVLTKAFRGELVPQDPADEPASVLLERIRAERGAASGVRRGHAHRRSGR